MGEGASKLSRMITLTDEQRAELLRIADGTSRGSYVAALTVLHLANGTRAEEIARVTFSEPADISRIEEAFIQQGIEAIRNSEPDQ